MDEWTQKWISRAIRDHLSGDGTVPMFCLCGICGDKATGKHYGALSCDGCKGFFRRSVRNKSSYRCRFSRNCVVDKDKRNQCRYCRLGKCFKVGMRVKAVQNERDKIRQHHDSTQDDQDAHLGLQVNTLMEAELHSREANKDLMENLNLCLEKPTSLKIWQESLQVALINLIVWAKRIPFFHGLSENDQIALLKACSVHNFILNIVWNYVISKNGNYVESHDTDQKKVNWKYSSRKISSQIKAELIRPLSEARLDPKEFTCLKAIAFFEPFAESLEDCTKIKMARYQVQVNLQDYVNDHQYDYRGRFGDLLLTMTSLKALSLELANLFKDANLCDESVIDGAVRSWLVDHRVIDIKPIIIESRPPDKIANGRKRRTRHMKDVETESSDTDDTSNSPPYVLIDPHADLENVNIKLEPDPSILSS